MHIVLDNLWKDYDYDFDTGLTAGFTARYDSLLFALIKLQCNGTVNILHISVYD